MIFNIDKFPEPLRTTMSIQLYEYWFLGISEERVRQLQQEKSKQEQAKQQSQLSQVNSK